ncbi:MAG: hypothetical protein QHD01_31960 [Bradyrhizobium sp.]|uniref:hypothetical protein n=1 Tax=Bradyrhizobium sp. TaxID=376 RepID=UPI0029BE85EB|nr:hypothetical protein [Bradyrhizobium sp.]MDX3971186.1 hypothetical protein [Bradyrhizobium sp.]
MIRTAILAALCCALFASVVEARPRHVRAAALDPGCNVIFPCEVASASLPARPARSRVRMAARPAQISAQILPHPAGCPRRAFCGCGAAVRLFGSPVRSLWLAAAWFKFPRSAPAPGTVAVRRHHVFVLESHLGGATWLAYDANSGGHRTRLHARSIAGYVIVDPRAMQSASVFTGRAL